MSGSEHGTAPEGAQMVGREPELLVLRRFLEGVGPATCLVLTGEAGIGKTTLWESGLAMARAQGFLVLSARAAQAEVALSFTTMADLIEGVDPEVLDAMPGPQVRALDVALRRRDPMEEAQDPFAIAAGLLSLFRALAERGPLLVAIDDVQWLDASSSDALLFAARRLAGDRARFLVTRRRDPRSDLERVLERSRIQRLDVAPLTFGATVRLLSERFGSSLTRRVLREVHETSEGNPLFALELSRLLVTRGILGIGSGLPTPDLVDDLFGPHVRELPEPVRRALLAVSLSAVMSRSELSSVVPAATIEDAVSAGILVVDRERVRPAHPMLAAAARKNSSAHQRQILHRDLAAAAGEPTVRAWHLANATDEPDRGVADIVAAAAERAAQRGAVQEAEELGAHALRLTPADDPAHPGRILALGRLHLRADEMTRVTDLLVRHMEELPPGKDRAFAHLLLSDAAGTTTEDTAHAEMALREGGDDPEIRARALAKLSRVLSQQGVTRIAEAEALALEGLAAARLLGPEFEERGIASLAWARIIQGCKVDDLWPLEPSPLRSSDGQVDRAIGSRLTVRGQLGEARAIIGRLLANADERGEVQLARLAQQQLCELELRAGNVDEATRLLHELDVELPWMGKVGARLHALLAAVAGDPEKAVQWAQAALDEGSGFVQGWDRLEAQRALGLAAILDQDPSQAVEQLGLVWAHTVREQVNEPGLFPVATDLVEALVSSGDIDAARAVTERLRRLATEQEHPWGLASATRCAACVDLAERYGDDAAAALEAAAADYGSLGLHFDQGRTLLLLGSLQRRFKKRSGARRSLGDAAAVFDRCGNAGWAKRARAELARVSGRRSAADGELTPSERQVVDLAVRGMSNKEIGRGPSHTRLRQVGRPFPRATGPRRPGTPDPGSLWSGCGDLNPGPPAPKAGALPSCATSRCLPGPPND
jgi:tetratricopeptide (TPR) repeat protein